MTILSAQSIRRRRPILDMAERTEVIHDGVRTSYGLSAAGYDLRLDAVAGYPGRTWWTLAPGKFVLASAVEQFAMPPDLLGIVHDKSSLARRGLAVQNTVIEPGWRGFLTIELTNHGPEPVKLHRGQGICQVIFHLLDEPTDQPYDGTYQDQPAIPVEAR